jgi:zinc protease
MTILCYVSAQMAQMTVQKIVLPNGFPMSSYVLPNGLKLHVVENHTAPVFTFETWFNVGSKDEKMDPGLKVTGLAHLFEHMMFRGTKKYPDGRFDEVLARNGVDDGNATTWLDRTNYYQSLPADRLELVMELESDRMANLAIDAKLLETEKGAVLGELRMGLDDPDTVTYDNLYETAFQVHPYRFTTIGSEEEIKSFTVENAMYFYRKYYAPNNATLIIVGDVDPGKTHELVKKYYGAYAAHPIDPNPAPAEPVQKSVREKRFQHPQLSQPRVLLAYPSVAVTHKDFAPLWVLMSALTYGQGAILEDRWVNRGIAISAYGDINQFAEPGLFILMADLQIEGEQASAEEIAEPEKILVQVLKELEKSFPESVLARARNQLLLSIYQQCEDNASLASFMGEFLASSGDPLFAFELLKRLESVQASDVSRVIGTYFRPERLTRIVGSPA